MIFPTYAFFFVITGLHKPTHLAKTHNTRTFTLSQANIYTPKRNHMQVHTLKNTHRQIDIFHTHVFFQVHNCSNLVKRCTSLFLGCVCSLLLFLGLCSAMLIYCIPCKCCYTTPKPTHSLGNCHSSFMLILKSFCILPQQLTANYMSHKSYVSSWLNDNNQHLIKKSSTLNKITLRLMHLQCLLLCDHNLSSA